MRVKFISSTGGTMYVDESRVEEYKAAGFVPVADAPKPKKSNSTRKKTAKKSEEVK